MLRQLAGVLFGVLLVLPAHAATGELWDYSMQMDMSGLKIPGGGSMPAMPARTTQICKQAGDWSKPPQDQKSDCKISDFSHNGNSYSWKVQCPQGSGSGTMTMQGSDAFTGVSEFTTAQGSMKMNITGKRAGGCDYASAQQGTPGPMDRELQPPKNTSGR